MQKVFPPSLPSTKPAPALFIILFLAALTYISLAFFWGKFSRAEVFFAESAREMLAAGNFITPLYHQKPFFDKPIFVYWLIISMFKTMGVNHFAARLPSIIASLITLASTAWAGSYLYSKRVGVIAAGMLGSAFMYLSFSSLCMSDMYLVMFDTLSLISIYAGIKSVHKRTLYWWLAAVSMGFAFLTKGPVGIVLPVISSLLFLALNKKLNLIKFKHIALALITIIIIASPWFYAAYLANGTGSLVYFFIRENIQRFAGDTYDAGKPFWYMIMALFLGFAPWSLLLPPAFWDFYKEWRTTRDQTGPQLFLWLWIFIAVGFFCISRGKCDYYTLPVYPAAAIICAQYIFSRLPKFTVVTIALICAIFISTTMFSAIVLPKINKLEPVHKYANIIEQSPADVRIGVDSKLSSWIDEILFQSGKDPEKLENPSQINHFITQNSPFLLIMPADKYNLLPEQQRSNWQIISRDKVATHPLTPGYLISRRGNIADPVPLVVATNMKDLKIKDQ